VVAGDFDGNGAPDLAVANYASSGSATVTVLLNAADWGGRSMPDLSNSTRFTQSQPYPDSLAVQLLAQPHAILQLPGAELPPTPAWPAAADETPQSDPREAISTSASVAALGHSQDAVFEDWIDPLVDSVGLSLVAFRRSGLPRLQ
jgi:hypothetical protein